MKKIFWLILIVIVLLIAWRVIVQIREKKADNGGSGRTQLAVPVEAVEAKHGILRDIGQFSGSLKAVSGYTIAPKVSGRLNRLLVNLGDRVSQGQLIAELDDEVYQQQLEQARADLAVANAQVEQTRLAWKDAETNLTATRTLFERNYSSQSELDKAGTENAAAKARYDIALATVQKAQAMVRASEIQLSNTRIKATWNGGGSTRLVGERFADEGDMLSANSPILTLLDNSSVTAGIDVIERDYAKLRIGQAVEVRTDAWPGRAFTGRLARLAPILQDASRQARAEIDIPNGDGALKPGMFVRVQIEYARHQDVLMVPNEAVVKRDGTFGVFRIRPDGASVEFLPVTPGISDGVSTEIVEPDFSGRVVILGQDQLQDGSKIKLPEAGGKAGPQAPGAKP
jgi:RND family efflux transporter MFP subunit